MKARAGHACQPHYRIASSQAAPPRKCACGPGAARLAERAAAQLPLGAVRTAADADLVGRDLPVTPGQHRQLDRAAARAAAGGRAAAAALHLRQPRPRPGRAVRPRVRPLAGRSAVCPRGPRLGLGSAPVPLGAARRRRGRAQTARAALSGLLRQARMQRLSRRTVDAERGGCMGRVRAAACAHGHAPPGVSRRRHAQRPCHLPAGCTWMATRPSARRRCARRRAPRRLGWVARAKCRALSSAIARCRARTPQWLRGLVCGGPGGGRTQAALAGGVQVAACKAAARAALAQQQFCAADRGQHARRRRRAAAGGRAGAAACAPNRGRGLPLSVGSRPCSSTPPTHHPGGHMHSRSGSFPQWQASPPACTRSALRHIRAGQGASRGRRATPRTPRPRARACAARAARRRRPAAGRAGRR